jgi:hypothetical protein
MFFLGWVFLTCASSCLLLGDAEARITRLPRIMFRAGRSRGKGGRGPRGAAPFAPLGFSVMGSGLSVYGGGLRGAFSSDMVGCVCCCCDCCRGFQSFWIRKEWEGLRVLRCWIQRLDARSWMTKWLRQHSILDTYSDLCMSSVMDLFKPTHCMHMYRLVGCMYLFTFDLAERIPPHKTCDGDCKMST